MDAVTESVKCEIHNHQIVGPNYTHNSYNSGFTTKQGSTYTKIVANIPIKQKNAHETVFYFKFCISKTRRDLILFAMK